MSAALDIIRTYRAPREVVRSRSAPPENEGRALAVLMAGCILMFVAQCPRLAREAFEAPEIPLEARLGAAAFGWLFIMPLVLYVLAGLTRLAARVVGGHGTAYGGRIALFWSRLAAAPLWLLNGWVAGFIGPGPLMLGTGLLATVVFLAFWMLGLVEVERNKAAAV